MKCKLCGTITRESSSEKNIIDFLNQRFTGKPKTYRQYFEENFPKDKFPNADYEGMCREMFFGNDNGVIIVHMGKLLAKNVGTKKSITPTCRGWSLNKVPC